MQKIMIKRVHNISIFDLGFVDVKYDDTVFDIKYAKSQRKIVLIRKSDGEIIHEFDEMYTNSITQYNCNGEPHFITNEYIPSKNPDRRFEGQQLVDYEYNFRRNGLDSTRIPCKSIKEVSDNAYIISSIEEGYELYSVENSISIPFKRVTLNESVNKMFGKKVVFVEHEIKDKYKGQIKDTLTYVIDPTTFKIISPIWSDLQKRFIDVYDSMTSEEIQKIAEKQDMSEVDNSYADNYNDSATIDIEVVNYLNKMARQLEIIDEELYDEQAFVGLAVCRGKKSIIKKFLPNKNKQK